MIEQVRKNGKSGFIQNYFVLFLKHICTFENI